jgi:AcrR family transcriptional regulator
VNTEADDDGGPRAGDARRRVGRPRKAPTLGSDDPREDLLRAAADLFATLGFAKATTRRIAEAAGLQQPSMFHYFRTKEDLLEALIDRMLEPQAKLGEMLDRLDAPPAVRLYVLVYADVLNICLAERNMGRLVRLPELNDARFRPVLERRRALRDRYRRLIETAASPARLLTPADVDLTTRLVFGLVESIGNWYQASGQHSGERVARTTADSVIELLVDVRAEVSEVRERAEALIADLDVASAARPFRYTPDGAS